MGNLHIYVHSFVARINHLMHSRQWNSDIAKAPKFLRRYISLRLLEDIEWPYECRTLAWIIVKVKQLKSAHVGSPQ